MPHKIIRLSFETELLLYSTRASCVILSEGKKSRSMAKLTVVIYYEMHNNYQSKSSYSIVPAVVQTCSEADK